MKDMIPRTIIINTSTEQSMKFQELRKRGRRPKVNTMLVGGIRRSPINSSILDGRPAVIGTYGGPFLKTVRGIVK